MHYHALTMRGRSFRLPSGIRYIRINPQAHFEKVFTVDEDIPGREVYKSIDEMYPISKVRRMVICFFVSVVAVQVNNFAGTLAAGGVFVSGMKTSVASRRQQNIMPNILEAQQFVAFCEDDLFSDDQDLVSYQTECDNYLKKGLAKTLASGTPSGLHNVDLLRKHALKKRRRRVKRGPLDKGYNPTEEKALLNVLHEVFANIDDPNFTQLAKEVLESNHGKLTHDRLLGCIRNERALKMCLDLVLTQVGSNHELRICEYEATAGQMFNDVVPQMSTHPKLLTLLDYTALVPADDTNLDIDVESGVNTLKWNLGETAPTVVTDADVIITYNFSVSQSNLRDSLSTLIESVKEDGFVLLCEATKNFAIPLFVNGMTTDFSNITDSRSCGPFCTDKEWKTIIQESGLEIIAQKSDGLMYTLFLCRKCSEDRYACDQTVIDVEDEAYEWVEDIKVAMQEIEDNPDSPNVWLKAENDVTNGIVGMLNCLREEPRGEKLRWGLQYLIFCLMNLYIFFLTDKRCKNANCG